eukprot:scaffold4783_cov373-Prasinococcus_capsulatus_cf.AAC.12
MRSSAQWNRFAVAAVFFSCSFSPLPCACFCLHDEALKAAAMLRSGARVAAQRACLPASSSSGLRPRLRMQHGAAPKV